MRTVIWSIDRMDCKNHGTSECIVGTEKQKPHWHNLYRKDWWLQINMHCLPDCLPLWFTQPRGDRVDWAAIVYRRLRSEPCTAQLTISHAPCECTAIATDDGINTSVHEDIQCIAREIDGKMDVLLQWYLGYFLRTTEEFKSMLNSNHKSCIQLCSGENRVEGYRL